MKPVIKVGRFFPVSTDGFILNDCPSEILHPWRDAVEAFNQEAIEAIGGLLHSLYIRGSIARGLAIAGVSDLDALAVVTGDVGNWVKTEWLLAAGKKLKQLFPFCVGLDVAFLDYEVLLNSNRGADYRFMIKTQSICIAGDDLSVSLPPFSPDLTIAFGCRCMKKDVAKFFERFAAESDAIELRAWCEWIMRKLLRAAGELAMLRGKPFTRDLSLCTDAYCELHPSRCDDVQNALHFAVNPSSEAAEVLPVVRNLSEKLQIEFDFASAPLKADG